MCSLHLTHPSVHTWSSGQPTVQRPWTSCRSRDSNPQPWVTSGFKSNALSIRPKTGQKGLLHGGKKKKREGERGGKKEKERKKL